MPLYSDIPSEWSVAPRSQVTAVAPRQCSGAGLLWRALCFLVCLLPAGISLACGWWGDSEERGVENAELVDADGRPTRRDDPMDNPERMVELGDAFRTGRGAPRDLNLALHWYRQAADRGHPAGQYNLALMYELGLGAVRDEARAAEWYRHAARQGDVHAQHHLGRMLLEGRGVARDEMAGLAWLEKAARQGHDEVFLMLSEAYARGQGASADPGLAYAWCWLAEKRGHAAAATRCVELAAQLDDEGVQKARDLALRLVGDRQLEGAGR